MTHTLHRIGSADSLYGDYVVQILTSNIGKGESIAQKGILNKSMATVQGLYKSKTAKRVERLIKKLLKENPAMQQQIENALLRLPPAPAVLGDIEHRTQKLFLRHLVVFNDKREMTAFLRRLKKADIGSSVVVSGLFDDVTECLKKIGICPHTVQFSLGIFGKTTLLPRKEVLEITTMCGHHLISSGLVTKLANDIKEGKISQEKAAEIMSKQCTCGAFNVTRASKLLRSFVVSQT